MNSVLRCVAKELSMRIIRRALLPGLLVIYGLGALVHGMLFHPLPVLVEEETPTTIEIPLPSAGPPLPDPAAPDGPPGFPGGMPFGGPRMIKKTVMRVDVVTKMVMEPEVMRDVSVGGLVRLPPGDEHAGELKRTYSGKGPALCPS
jgi:hypothetical protein